MGPLVPLRPARLRGQGQAMGPRPLPDLAQLEDGDAGSAPGPGGDRHALPQRAVGGARGHPAHGHPPAAGQRRVPLRQPCGLRRPQ
eukprot:13869282-Alexandrium_andersonii.AAC.1